MCKGVKDMCGVWLVWLVWFVVCLLWWYRSMFVGGIGESGRERELMVCLVMEYGHDLAVVLRVLYVSGLTWCGGLRQQTAEPATQDPPTTGTRRDRYKEG